MQQIKIIFTYIVVFLISVLLFSFSPFANNPNTDIPDKGFMLGNESLLKNYPQLIRDKRIGLITNKSGVIPGGFLFVDALDVFFKITRIFTPEHGLRGDDMNENSVDVITEIPMISLYGKKEKIESNDLTDVDVLVYDMQDVAARFYTFINTMYYSMEAAYENDKEFIVCDRPIIPYGDYTDGFMLDDGEKSFVGLLKIPIAYGMTCGELALYINDKYFSNRLKLEVVKMENYQREMNYTSLGLPWVKPSPNMYFPSSAITYLGTCLLEGTNFAEGRGTEKPFEYIGAPYCDGEKLSNELNSYDMPGVRFEKITFTPGQASGSSHPPKFINIQCEGVYINVTNYEYFEPVKAGIAILVSLKKLFPEFQINRNNFIDKLAGTRTLRNMLENGSGYHEIVESYKNELSDFKSERKQFLLY